MLIQRVIIEEDVDQSRIFIRRTEYPKEEGQTTCDPTVMLCLNHRVGLFRKPIQVPSRITPLL